jgi:YVTN family beta-propeller protein
MGFVKGRLDQTTIHARRPSAILACVIAVGLIASGTALLTRAQSVPAVTLPGSAADGSILLPNGWRLAPAGRQVTVGDLPLNIVSSPDSKYLIVTNNGLAAPTFSIIDVATWKIKNTMALAHAWYGLVWHPDGTRLYSAGANQNNVQEFSYVDGTLTRARTFALPTMTGDTFVGGLAISRDGRTLYVTRLFAMTVSAIDVSSGQVVKTVTLRAEPYTSVLSTDGRYLFVSLWGGSSVVVLDAQSLTLINEIPVGEHPNALVPSPDGTRLFVACGNSADVWVISTIVFEAIEQISLNLFPDSPPASTPNSLTISPDGKRLLVALADSNAVGVIDVSNSVRSLVEGFIPTGWYPTGAIFSQDGRQIFVLSGKGSTSAPQLPGGPGMESRLLGSVAVLATPDRTTLAEYTRKVYSLAPFSDAARTAPGGVPIGSPIPQTVGTSSPIKYVFYVIRENRTYDQILGDLPQGNGDPRLTGFGNDVTPNAHALAQSFVLFDNFYVDADVSYNGHAFSTAAYATDFVQKLWQVGYGGRGGPYLAEGGGLLRNPFGNITAPMGGYIWDYASRARVTVRSYGEFVEHTRRMANGDVTAVEAVPGLKGAVAPAFAGWDLEITDNRRIDTWLEEFNGFVVNKHLPRLSIVRLANDHTNGTKPGAPTPRAMIADNDLAVGRLVEAVSNSVYWKETAIFIVEDDAQSGPDHVDSHRSVLLVASPFAKRGFVDHTLYTTSGVLRTIELILGIPPMSQYDAAATPLVGAFNSIPDLSFFRRRDARIPLDEKNLPSAPGAAASLAMDFSEADRTPEVLLNDIIWRSVKGADSPMPPPRRSVFIRPASGTNGDEDDDD